MAKKTKTILIKLVSSAKTGYFYVTSKNTLNTPQKLVFRKYDPVIKRHVLFTEARVKK